MFSKGWLFTFAEAPARAPRRVERGITLTSVLSRQGRGGKRATAGGRAPRYGWNGESPSPQSSPVKGEEARGPPRAGAPLDTHGSEQRRSSVEIPEDEAWTLQSDRLVLSPMVRDDACELFGLWRDPVLYRFTGGVAPASVDDVRERIRLREGRRSPDGDELWLNWTLRLRSSGQAVGYVQAGVREGRADLAWVVGVPFQNRGYATEAGRRATAWIREHCGVSELRAAIHPDHAASCRVAAHIGLRPSGELTDEGEQLWTTTHRG